MPVTCEVFGSFEDEMRRLKEVAGFSPPSPTAGSRAFFASLNAWFFPRAATTGGAQTVVLPDPTFNLSLPYPEDELRIAAGGTDAQQTDASLRARLAAFALPVEVLSRPVTALSGGERMLVSLCKASLQAPRTRNLLVCSPYFWLDPEHRRLVHEMISDQDGRGVRSHMLLLDGEDDGVPGTPEMWPSIASLTWALSFSKATVVFPASRFPRETPQKTLRFSLARAPLLLRSPTLITGSNGVGKTTFAKLLGGLLSTTDETPRLITDGFSGTARLLMQDSTVQLFGQPPDMHLERVFHHDTAARQKALALFQDMQSACARQLAARGPTLAVGDREQPHTVCQAKLALAAERLVSRCPLLILDEPGWCLSRPVAQVLVHAIVSAAHERHIAVAIVSHQTDWWIPLCGDRLHFRASPSPDTILLSKGEDIA